MIDSQAQATKRAQESYTYAQERGFDVAEKVAQNEAVGQFTNMGVGLGTMAGVGGAIGGGVGGAVNGAMSGMISPDSSSTMTPGNETSLLDGTESAQPKTMFKISETIKIRRQRLICAMRR